MNLSKRRSLKSLSALALLVPTLARAGAPATPVNLIGSGSCGKRVVQLLDRRGLIERDFVLLHKCRVDDARNFVEELREDTAPHRGRPLVLLTAVGGAGGEHALRIAQSYGTDWRSDVSAVLFIPFAWEGSRRLRAFGQVDRFRQTFRRVTTIDNQEIDEEFLPAQYEMSLLDFYGVINTFATTTVEQVIAASRQA